MPASRWHGLPAAVYALVDETPGTVLLEGSGPGRSKSIEKPREEPWTRLFTAPLRVCVAYHAAEVAALFAQVEQALAAGLSAAGFFSYECGAAFEAKAGMRPARAGMPLAWLGIYERGYAFHHESGEFEDAAPPQIRMLRSEAASVLSGNGAWSSAEQAFSCAEGSTPHPPALAGEVSFAADFGLSESDYAGRIAAIHEYIRAGDIYQLNFTAPLHVHAPDNAARLYARLRARQPAHYGAFLHWQRDRRIQSFSPELFFRIDGGGPARHITTRPMKGTAPRGRTSREDRAMAEWLRGDAKNRSENLMIVDLVRNDLGRVARTGSVRAEELFTIERLPLLWQMTSTVTAELRDDAGFEAIFRALFPCGSVTGAPKVRATQLIGDLEDAPRGVYTGAIGFFSPRETVFNVAIRTLQLEGGQGTMGVGSGVVIDSDAPAEYRECLLKAEFLRGCMNPQPPEFSLVETMLWEGGFPLLNLHLDRLTDSADYFDFPCDRAAVKTALEQHALSFQEDRPRKVRLLLAADGSLQIADEILAAPPGNPILRVRIAPERTDPSDVMLFHKTTHRPLYAQAFEKAQREGFDDVLFLNRRGEVTEGAISNLFLEKDGAWSTPALDCGLLPGVYRRYLLEQRPSIEERVLRELDLRNADAIYLANAVRGLRRVKLVER